VVLGIDFKAGRKRRKVDVHGSLLIDTLWDLPIDRDPVPLRRNDLLGDNM
jgi:hypothetical protein